MCVCIMNIGNHVYQRYTNIAQVKFIWLKFIFM